ncbi:plant expansin [Suillus bovinus]|uniref:plant expansin n=1 Tax=Suillus bovinus TaxID=48563 RepID=UPI001B87D40F|nr:plant expansin [Suillus bovinus]KAG2145382.1 plant expansin [Suillus bovinus]
MLMFSIFLLVSAILPFTVGGKLGHIQRGRHQELAQRARGDVGIHKRSFDNARMTFYDVGLGACGQYSSPGDFIVALNVAQFGGGYPGPECFKSITISYGGKTTQATIMDECMGCPLGGLDFSEGLFEFFSSLDEGVIYGSWWFNDGTSEPTPSASPEWTPTPIPALSTPAPTSTSTYVTPSETPTSTPSTTETSTTSETPTSTPSTSETSPTATATYSSLSTLGTDIPIPTGAVAIPVVVPVPAPNAANPENIEVLGQALINLGMLLAGQRGN